jgi:hypothetical protein
MKHAGETGECYAYQLVRWPFPYFSEENVNKKAVFESRNLESLKYEKEQEGISRGKGA